MPRLSIVTASLNTLPALKATAASVARQINRDFEHIVVDGGSDDGTREWLESQPALRWISEPDEGIADALNKGFGLATGEFVLVLQAGDTFLTDRSVGEALERSAAAPLADIVAFAIMFGDERYSAHYLPSLRLEWKPLRHQGVLFRKSLFDRLGPFDTGYRICMDYDLLLRAKRGGACIRGVRHAITRMDPGGISSLTDWPSLQKRFAEERRIHLAYCGKLGRLLYSLYWPLYLWYRSPTGR